MQMICPLRQLNDRYNDRCCDNRLQHKTEMRIGIKNTLSGIGKYKKTKYKKTKYKEKGV